MSIQSAINYYYTHKYKWICTLKFELIKSMISRFSKYIYIGKDMGSASSVTVSKEDTSKSEKNILTKKEIEAKKTNAFKSLEKTSKLFWTLMGIWIYLDVLMKFSFNLPLIFYKTYLYFRMQA